MIRHPAFQKFIDDLRDLWSSEQDMQRRMELSRPLLRELLGDTEVQTRSADWPSTEGRKNLLFYVDPDYGFAINGVVRTPGRKGSVHDHAAAWVLYGVLTGTESLERYHRIDDGTRAGYAVVELTSVTEGSSGKVDIVAPWEIHAEQGGPGRSAAIILRSERLGEMLQNTFDPDDHTVLVRPGPAQIPYELSA